MGGKGVEPLRTFVHTVLSRTRLPFRHSPMYKRKSKAVLGMNFTKKYDKYV